MGFKLTPDRLFPNNMSGQLTIPQLQVRPAYYSPITGQASLLFPNYRSDAQKKWVKPLY